LYTSNAIVSTTNATTANSVINGVTLTATKGDKSSSGSDGDVTINATSKSVVATGGTHS
jgi:hypothetical protein